MISRLVGESNKKPATLHCLVTTQCGLDCEGCFYVTGESGAWSWKYAESIVEQAGRMGVKWLAIGGGEPTLWPFLNDMCILARKAYGMRTAVTTNGMQKRPICADKVHISYDERHWSKWPEESQKDRVAAIRGIINYYGLLGCRTGINTVLQSVPDVETEVLDNVESITIMMDKPYNAKTWPEQKVMLDEQVKRCSKHAHVSIDSCLAQMTYSSCAQGRISMAIDQHGKYSMCSNCSEKFEATSLEVAWDLVRCKKEDLPDGCILRKED